MGGDPALPVVDPDQFIGSGILAISIIVTPFHWIFFNSLATFILKLLVLEANLKNVMKPQITQGDLLDQDVEVIVNAWNRNFIPWWLLVPQGVSGAIKKRAGLAPFRELAKKGIIPLGGAVITSAGRLKFKNIIHVAGINLLWFATDASIRRSVRSAMQIVNKYKFKSVAFPIIGSGSGSRSRKKAFALMIEAFETIDSPANVIIVEHSKSAGLSYP
jgi:O-acetyl-ADP-ribose deacetylase